MPTVYRAEINVSGLSLVGPDPTSAYPVPTQAEFGFACYDDNDNMYALLVFLSVHFTSLGVREYQTVVFPVYRRFLADTNDPLSWSTLLDTDYPPSVGTHFPVKLEEPDGGNGAWFFGGGVFAIEKDVDNGQFHWITPFGTITTPYTWLSDTATIGNSPLRIGGQQFWLERVTDDTVQCEITLSWDTFQTKTNGTVTSLVHMSNADPGVWDGWASTSQALNPTTLITTQNTLSFQTQIDHLSTTTGDSSNTSWYRFLAGTNLGALSIDLTCAREHAILLAGWLDATSPNGMTLRRSFDHGASWDSVPVSSDLTCLCPNVQWFGGTVQVVYDNGSGIRASHSRDLGISWTTPLSVSITGTNPRLIISPEGMFFYFYCNAGNLMLARSDDFGVSIFDLTPITVATAVSPQTIGAVFSVDGSIVVSYIFGGSWTSRRSRDLGLTWSVL